ncbi:VWA domain-containing protein [Allobranchiibius sp. CTAmp26]|uniref:VWA domain-containing protein n=1 Tax=Allobranchiibius sp. CTAmp26 TaxID=2815214 RepID=UPI001AA180E0|nr:VWA domain-containing protein [Allobranchiibius sp. CTAmp26]MBO1755822.1 VWA domain-containing protein [Allobranchiibius sp. CTAmp26]
MPSTAESALGDRLVELTTSLRDHGVRVGTSEIADAARIATALGLDDRIRLRGGVAAAMLRRAGDREVFDRLFDLYFPAAPGRRTVPQAESVDQLREQLVQALADNDAQTLDDLAAAAVDLLGEVANGDEQQGYSSAQTISRLQPQRAIAAAQQQSRGPRGEGSGQGGEQLSDRFDRDELRARVAVFRRRVEAEALRRNTQVRSRERVARFGVGSGIEQRDFLSAGTKDLDELRRHIDPLARKLAARMSARRAAGRGAIDVRRTLRRSLSTGGVPIDPAYRERRRHRPDLIVLADLSGSVGAFSTFTMLLMQALHAQFRKVRAYGFVSSAAEITDVLRDAEPGAPLGIWARRTREFTAHGTSSSYGTAFRGFVRSEWESIGPRSTVLILGDARTNYGDPGVAHVAAIAARARHVAWLNPEPARMWDTGDSVAAAYGAVVDMHECRNLDQLRAFVARVLPI